ncbi:MAG: ribosomal-processing cysteine protease Prp [Clostridia bacterium]|nr:ribosomal-processing cysteine protease Prp [Clostridia bacterium]
MTKVRFFERNGLLFGIESQGHSGYASEGEDIVCSAVSTVMTMAECYLTDICGYDTSVEIDSDEPRISVKLESGTEEEKQNCNRILRAAKATLEENAREYSLWLRVSVITRG